jgi:hypothetical protein
MKCPGLDWLRRTRFSREVDQAHASLTGIFHALPGSSFAWPVGHEKSPAASRQGLIIKCPGLDWLRRTRFSREVDQAHSLRSRAFFMPFPVQASLDWSVMKKALPLRDRA